MISFEKELREIFGDKYEGCTQRNDELVEYRLKSGEVASLDELAQVASLPKGIKAKIAELEERIKVSEKQ